jgi:hypothetical protein
MNTYKKAMNTYKASWYSIHAKKLADVSFDARNNDHAKKQAEKIGKELGMNRAPCISRLGITIF